MLIKERNLMRTRLITVIAQRNALQNELDKLAQEKGKPDLRRNSFTRSMPAMRVPSADESPLPHGWDMVYDAKGRPYFIGIQ